MDRPPGSGPVSQLRTVSGLGVASELDAAIDFERPSTARIYDYWLGGGHNFAADRAAADKVTEAVPNAPAIARANREFLNRSVRWLVGQGIRQFLDVGSGIPTAGNVHEVAQELAPDSTVLYVDIDPVAVMHSRQILTGNARARAIGVDLRDPAAILGDPQLPAVLDLSRPVALLLVSVLHFVPDSDDPAGKVRVLRDALAPGSYLAISHAATGNFPAAGAVAAQQVYRQASNGIGGLRTAEEIRAFFGDWTLVEPGLVGLSQWRPDEGDDPADHPGQNSFLAGVGRKP